MTLDNFLEYVKTRKALDTEDIHRFMDEMSNEARRITFKLNASFHAPDEVRALLSELFGKPVPPSLRVFPPFYTDFGKNIEIGNDVFINACCHFQDHGGVTLGDGCQKHLPPYLYSFFAGLSVWHTLMWMRPSCLPVHTAHF